MRGKKKKSFQIISMLFRYWSLPPRVPRPFISITSSALLCIIEMKAAPRHTHSPCFVCFSKKKKKKEEMAIFGISRTELVFFCFYEKGGATVYNLPPSRLTDCKLPAWTVIETLSFWQTTCSTDFGTTFWLSVRHRSHPRFTGEWWTFVIITAGTRGLKKNKK
jgi:hypothetical protein